MLSCGVLKMTRVVKTSPGSFNSTTIVGRQNELRSNLDVAEQASQKLSTKRSGSFGLE